MDNLIPKIDPRNFDDLFLDLIARAPNYIPEWDPERDSEPGAAIARIFLNMHKEVQQRVNRIPEKFRIAFLDYLGFDMMPAQSARSWVTFSLVPGAPGNVSIISGSEITGKGKDSEGKDKDAPFQTLRDVVVSPAALTDIVSIDFLNDEIFIHPPTTMNSTILYLFEGTNSQEHCLYISHSDLLNITMPAKIILDFVVKTGVQKDIALKNAWFDWEYYNGKKWVFLGRIDKDTTNSFQVSGSMIISKDSIGEISEVTINGLKSRWIRCRVLKEMITDFPVNFPDLDTIKISVRSFCNLEPEMLFSNNNPLDVGIIKIPLPGIDVGQILFTGQLKDENINFGSIEVLLKCSGELKSNDRIAFENGSEWKIEKILKPNMEDSICKVLLTWISGDNDISNIDINTTARLLTAIREAETPIVVRFPTTDDFIFPENRIVYFVYPGDSPDQAFTTRIISIEDRAVTVQLNYAPGFTTQLIGTMLEREITYLTPHIKPFGELPNSGDCFYIANNEAFSKKNGTVDITFTYAINGNSDVNFNSYNISAILVWEYWNGVSRTWRLLKVIDGTSGFKNIDSVNPVVNKLVSTWKTATLTFKCPDDITKVKVNGEENFWIRARILEGDYGKLYVKGSIKVAEYNADGSVKRDTKGNIIYTEYDGMVPGIVHFPIIRNINIEYQLNQVYPRSTICYNNADYVDCSIAAQKENIPFKPFRNLPLDRNAIFLGFDKQLNGGPLRILFNLAEEFKEQVMSKAYWSYWNGTIWKEIIIDDSTMGLRRNGTVELFGSRDFALCELFDRNRYWVRILPSESGFAQGLGFRGIYFNSVDVIQSSIIEDEQLGASDGTSNQSFATVNSPIINQYVWVREPMTHSEEILEKIYEAEGRDAYTVIPEGNLWTNQVWIRWHEKFDFDDTGPDDRHFIVDKRTGVIRFGDGIKSMIPPKESSNIKITYRYGGGVVGNVPHSTINSLKSNIPFIDTVSNPFAAEGGTEAQKAEHSIIISSQILKHRNRAVTEEDYQHMACQISRAVARAHCLSNIDDNGMYNPGWVSILIIPDITERPPIPKQELISLVKTGLQEVCAGTITAVNRISVRSPVFVSIRVEATLVPIKADYAAQVVENAIEALNRFLDPLTGGLNKTGWEFGGTVNYSSIIAILESIDNVDYTLKCQIFVEEKPFIEDIPLSDDMVVVSGVHSIDLSFNSGISTITPG